MANPLALMPQAVNQARPQIVSTTVSGTRPTPTTFNDPLYVVNPADTDHFWTISKWISASLPAAGAPVTLVEDHLRQWVAIVAAQGAPPPTSLPPTGTATGDLAGSYPSPTVAKVNGVTVPLTGAAWIAPTLTNSWANQGGAFETTGYLKDPLGFVHLKGVITGGASNTTAFTLPAGYRPGATTMAAMGAAGGTSAQATAQISTAGAVTVEWTVAGSFLGLSGVTFLAEN